MQPHSRACLVVGCGQVVDFQSSRLAAPTRTSRDIDKVRVGHPQSLPDAAQPSDGDNGRVPTMDELLAQHGVTGPDADHLHRLVGDWQLLADLSFADLLLFVPVGRDRYVTVAQMRPTTGPTAYQ